MSIFVSLHTDEPPDEGNEVSFDGYARRQVDPERETVWSPVTGPDGGFVVQSWALWDSPEGGTLLASGIFSVPAPRPGRLRRLLAWLRALARR